MHNSIIPPLLYSIFSIYFCGVRSSIKNTESLTNVYYIYLCSINYYLGRDDLNLQKKPKVTIWKMLYQIRTIYQYAKVIKKNENLIYCLPHDKNERNKSLLKKVKKRINHFRGDVWNETAVVGQDRSVFS